MWKTSLTLFFRKKKLFKFYASIKIQNITTRSELFHSENSITTMNVFTRPNFLIFFFSDMYNSEYICGITCLSHIFSLPPHLILISLFLICSRSLLHTLFFLQPPEFQNEKFETKAKEMTQLFTKSFFYSIFQNFPIIFRVHGPSSLIKWKMWNLSWILLGWEMDKVHLMNYEDCLEGEFWVG